MLDLGMSWPRQRAPKGNGAMGHRDAIDSFSVSLTYTEPAPDYSLIQLNICGSYKTNQPNAIVFIQMFIYWSKKSNNGDRPFFIDPLSISVCSPTHSRPFDAASSLLPPTRERRRKRCNNEEVMATDPVDSPTYLLTSKTNQHRLLACLLLDDVLKLVVRWSYILHVGRLLCCWEIRMTERES